MKTKKACSWQTFQFFLILPLLSEQLPACRYNNRNSGKPCEPVLAGGTADTAIRLEPSVSNALFSYVYAASTFYSLVLPFSHTSLKVKTIPLILQTDLSHPYLPVYIRTSRGSGSARMSGKCLGTLLCTKVDAANSK